jgi:ABC-2 type transport system permease protein
MTALTLAWADSATMLRRNLRRSLRYPVAAAAGIGIPLALLLLFVFVFGDTMGAGLAGPGAGRDAYLDFITPGIALIAVAGAAQAVAIAVAMDMTEGIVQRFRAMSIARGSVLTGHVLASLVQTLAAVVVVLGAAVLLGFDARASALDWLAALGLMALVSFGVIWLSVALGLLGRTVEAAINPPLPHVLLTYHGSGFVPTDSMPAGVRWFAEHQPFTPVMDTLRGLLLGTPVGDSAALAVGWSVAIALGGWLWARRLYDREPPAL